MRRKFTKEHKQKLSKAHLGISLSEKHKKAIKGSYNSGRFLKGHPPLKDISGEKNPAWKGGISKKRGYIAWASHKRRIREKEANGFHTLGEWELLKKQYGYICPSCKRKEPEIKLTEDHIIPLSRGGSDFIENIQPLCRLCNNKKFIKIIKYDN